MTSPGDESRVEKSGQPAARRRVARRVLAALLIALSIPMLAPLSLLAILAETRTGRLFGLFGAAGVGLAACGFGLLWPIGRPRAWAIAGAVLALAMVGLGLAIASIPRPAGTGGATGLRSVTFGPAARIGPGVLGRLPEIDLVKLGASVATRLAPWLSGEQRRRIRAITLGLERDVEADPDARAIPGATHLALAELAGRPFEAGHYYAYVPAREADGRLGAIVFLHGNAGNFRINAWAWRRFAEAHRFAILAPTHGFGFWGPESVATVGRALDDALARLPIDPGNVYLAGISDGGNGVTRAGSAESRRYRGLIYVSPTLRIDEVGSPAFVEAWKGRPVLVIQGDRDVNVRKADVDPAVERMRDLAIDVTYRVFPGEDHFLFFGRGAEVFAAVADWMGPARSRGLIRGERWPPAAH